MSEYVFPISATLIVYLVAIPICTFIGRLYLEWQGRYRPHPHEAGHFSTLAAIAGPVLIPIFCVGGAAFHRFDGHHAYEVCLVGHGAEPCAEAIALALFVALPLVVATLLKFRFVSPRGEHFEGFEELGVDVRLVDEAVLCTRGLVRPWIEVGRSLVDELTDEQLRAALLHEKAHARGLDPLFTFVGEVCMSVNPARGLVRRWFERWHLGREIRCDLTAISLGGNRFSLAESLLRVARRTSGGGCAHGVNLTGAAASIRVRVAVLVGNDIPEVRSDRALWLASFIFCGAIIATFAYCEMSLLDSLHHQTERLFQTVIR